ncbi:hypothetical protein ANTRET_LOCUS4112 [Anthophora retusa]
MKYHDARRCTFLCPKALEVFSISGNGSYVSAFTPSPSPRYLHPSSPSSPAKNHSPFSRSHVGQEGGPVDDTRRDTVNVEASIEIRRCIGFGLKDTSIECPAAVRQCAQLVIVIGDFHERARLGRG